MGIYANNYIPHLKKVVDSSEVGFEFVTGDKKGKILYTNNDDFIFYGNDGSQSSLNNMKTISGSTLSKTETSISSAELNTGVVKQILPSAPPGYIYIPQNIVFVYNYNTSAYTTGLIASIKAKDNGNYINYYTLRYEGFIHADRSRISVLDGTINNLSLPYLYNICFDADTDYTITFQATTGGLGTVKIICYYTIEETT